MKTLTKRLMQACVVLAALFLLPVSCKKYDAFEMQGPDARTVHSFFSLENVTEPEIVGLINDLKSDAKFVHNLPSFIARNGVPLWNSTVNSFQQDMNGMKISNRERLSNAEQNTGSGESGVFIVPLKAEDGTSIASYIVAKKHRKGDYSYALYNRTDIDGIDIKTEDEKRDTKEIYAVFAHFEKEVNNNVNFTPGNQDLRNTSFKDAEIKIGKARSVSSKAARPERLATITPGGRPSGIETDPGCFTDVSLEVWYGLNANGDVLWVHNQYTIEITCVGPEETVSWIAGDPNNNPPPAWYEYGYPGGYYLDSCKCYLTTGGVVVFWTPTLVDVLNAHVITTEEQAILDSVAAEDAAVDAYFASQSDCTGTGRSGNAQYWGTMEHWIIQFAYMAENWGSMREYQIPNAGPSGGKGYADIVNPATKEMFEIKPFTFDAVNQGKAELLNYVDKANQYCPPPGGGAWSIGNTYPTQYLPHPRFPGKVMEASYAGGGVVGYRMTEWNNVPQTKPILIPDDNIARKLREFIRYAVHHVNQIDALVLKFLQEHRYIIPYLQAAAVGVVVATIIEDIATAGVGIVDDWASFLVARSLWRLARAPLPY